MRVCNCGSKNVAIGFFYSKDGKESIRWRCKDCSHIWYEIVTGYPPVGEK
jgi:hypothetical protein